MYWYSAARVEAMLSLAEESHWPFVTVNVGSLAMAAAAGSLPNCGRGGEATGGDGDEMYGCTADS